MIAYLLETSIILSACYLFYRVLLQKETFFKLNRWFLICCLVASFAIPFLELPELFPGLQNWGILPSSASIVEQLSSEPVAADFTASPPIVDPNTGQAINYTDPGTVSNADGTAFNWIKIVFYAYLFGLVVFGGIFIVQLLTVARMLLKSKSIMKDKGNFIVEIDETQSPHSFFNFIFINPANYDWEGYNQILDHEKVHSLQIHSLDIFLAELALIFQWFNPFAWKYRRVLENNLEFLTDATLVKKYNTASRESYQWNLVKVACPNFPLGITTNFNQNLIKKRIQMINAKKSSNKSLWKYPFILPVFFLSFMLFKNEMQSQVIYGTENFTPVQVGDPMGNMNWEAATNGNWNATFEGDQVCFKMHGVFENDKDKNWNTERCFPVSELNNIATNGDDLEFNLQRDGGTITFKGDFSQGEGNGTYVFEANEAYKSFLGDKGMSQVSDGKLFFMCLTNINKAYISFLEGKGYDIDDKLYFLAFSTVDLDYLKKQLAYFEGIGYSDIPLEKSAILKSLDVGREYLQPIMDLGYNSKNLSIEDMIGGKSLGIDVDYIKSYKRENEDYPPFGELLFLKAMQASRSN